MTSLALIVASNLWLRTVQVLLEMIGKEKDLKNAESVIESLIKLVSSSLCLIC